MITLSIPFIKRNIQALQKKTENPLYELSILVSYILKKPIEQILPFIYNYKLSIQNYLWLKLLISKRIKGCPIAYITGEKYFYGSKFVVNKNVLIPRDDSETLTEEVIEKTKIVYQRKKKTVLCHEIGVGSGAVLISVAKECVKQNIPIKITGTDVSKKALDIAQKNVHAHRFDGKITLQCSSRYLPENNGKSIQNEKIMYDVIYSNPPYISDFDYIHLPDEIKKYEPKSALSGRKDGDYFYRDILAKVKNHIAADGFILFEVGDEKQCKRVCCYLKNTFGNTNTAKDLGGHVRVCYAKRRD